MDDQPSIVLLPEQQLENIAQALLAPTPTARKRKARGLTYLAPAPSLPRAIRLRRYWRELCRGPAVPFPTRYIGISQEAASRLPKAPPMQFTY